MNEITEQPATMWRLNIDQDQVAWLEFDTPNASVNTLSHVAMKELNDQLTHIEALKLKALIIISSKKSGFIAGADIKEFVQLKSFDEAYTHIREGQQVLDRLEHLHFPTLAAIHGFALGGGLELALTCTYRIAASDVKTVLGLPEVKLGIHPGFGGTVRSSRLLGALSAMELMLTGKTIKADKALTLGLIDQLAPINELRTTAKALTLSYRPARRPAFISQLINWSFIRSFVANKLRQQTRKYANPKHYPAPFALIDLWQKYGSHNEQAYEAEARSVAHLFCTDTSKNLVRTFMLQERLKGLGNASDHPATRVHVIGAGVMGGDIASWCALRGLQVTLEDRELKFIEPALTRAEELFTKHFSDINERKQALTRLQADVSGEGVKTADIVIEAIFENVEAKQALYKRLEPQLKSGAILATNTSSIVLETLAEGLSDPSRFVGVHFFNPVSHMPLVEVISSDKTRPEVIQAALNFTRQLDKLPVPCRSAPGFVVNRILMPYLNEAMRAADEGIPLSVIDQAATDFGMPMGPIELADVVGLDVCLHVGTILSKAYNRPQAQIIKQLVEQKKLGKKSGEGFYRWQDGKPINPKAGSLPCPKDLEDRLILSMVNESMAVLREQVIADADLLDAAVIFGTGFAPFLGGPLNYARSLGNEVITTKLDQLADQYGLHFKPDAGWFSQLI